MTTQTDSNLSLRESTWVDVIRLGLGNWWAAMPNNFHGPGSVRMPEPEPFPPCSDRRRTVLESQTNVLEPRTRSDVGLPDRLFSSP